jgi:aldehyde:ferredoxin oxidoreductase
LRAGERIWNIERLFNIGAGLTPADDSLPKRMMEEPISDGPAKGKTAASLLEMLPLYYSKRGWSEAGVPTPEKITELEIGG